MLLRVVPQMAPIRIATPLTPAPDITEPLTIRKTQHHVHLL